MEPNGNLVSELLAPTESKRKYQSPILLTFGKVAALTRQSACSATKDSTTTCTPGGSQMAMTSDQRAKEDIVRIGSHPLGIGLYLFRYRPPFRDEWGHGRQFGVMAQEVEAVMPEAVCVHPNGFRMVNYSMLGITRFAH